MFRIYYGDGTTFEGEPRKAPTQGVQCIAWDDPIRGISNTGRVVIHDWDLYIYVSDIGWIGTNKYADLVRHVQDGNVVTVLEGKWIGRESYMAIRNRAWNDPPLNKKSATHPSEDGTE